MTGERVMKTDNGDEIIEVKCPNCGDEFIGWPEQKDTPCLECYAEKEICNVTE